MQGDAVCDTFDGAVATWLQQQRLCQAPEGRLLLTIDVVDLACNQQHPDVLAALLKDAEQLRQAVLAVLQHNQLLEPGQRVWLRPKQLPAAAELSVPNALRLMALAPGALFSCHGICVAATAPFQVPAQRSFQCLSCGKVATLFGTGPPPPCCSGRLREVERARVMVQSQLVYLSSDTLLTGLPPGAHPARGLLAVQLTDDLCGRVVLGDRVLATGCCRYFGGGASTAGGRAGQLPVTVEVKMEACNVRVLELAQPRPATELSSGAQRHLAGMASGGLEALLQVLSAALPAAGSTMLRLAVLLSAAAAGTGSSQLAGSHGAGGAHDEDPEPQALLHAGPQVSRHQVHLMLTSSGPEPHIQRFLSGAAALLCEHSVGTAPDNPRALLPSLDSKYEEPSLGLKVPLAVGGRLAEAAAGVLLLPSWHLDAKRAHALGQLISAGKAVLLPGCPELRVPVKATIWTTVHEQDLSKSGQCFAGSGGGSLSLTEGIISRFSQPFFAQHDLLVAAGPETEEEVEDMVDSILMPRTAGHEAASNHRNKADARAALQYHMQATRAAPQPVLSPQTAALLAAYFQHVRVYAEAQQGVLSSLVRMTCGSARLRHSRVAEPLPDGAVAVAFVEEKLVAAGAMPVFWPRWREELRRCTPLAECLRGLLEDCSKGLGLAGAEAHDRLYAAEE